jgi:hypothetical protein
MGDEVLLQTDGADIERNQAIEKPQGGEIAETEQRNAADKPEDDAKQSVDVWWDRGKPETLPSIKEVVHRSRT